MGLGEAARNIKILDEALEELTALAGQKPVMTRARKSIAQFKLREGMPIGARVTLRGDNMWDFLDRLINVGAAAGRDFRGVPRKSFDGRGNYTLGVKDQLIFPRSTTTRSSSQGDEHHHHHHRGQRRAGAVHAPRARHAVHRHAEERIRGHHCQDREDVQEAQVRGSSPQPLPAVRAAARLPAQVRRCAASVSACSPCRASCRA